MRNGMLPIYVLLTKACCPFSKEGVHTLLLVGGGEGEGEGLALQLEGLG